MGLDRLHQEAEIARLILSNGAGRRAREKARTTIQRLERRALRLRASLEACESRLEALASRPSPDFATLTPAQRIATIKAEMERSTRG